VFDMGFGDSIAAQQFANPALGRAMGRMGGTAGMQYDAKNPADFVMGENAGVGDPPDRILARMRYMLQQNPDYFRGKNVFATSGSNDPSKLGDVATLVSELKRAGANSVVMPGVGPGVQNSEAVNTVLQNSVKDAGGIFFQPQIKWAKDGVHPASGQDMYDQAVKAYYGGQVVPPVAAGPAATPTMDPVTGAPTSLQPQQTPQNALVPPPARAPAGAPVAYTGPFPDIYAGAAPYGVDPSLVMATAAIESNYGRDPNTNTPGKTYRGIFQLGPDEWNQMGGGDRDDRALQIDHGVRLLAQRKQELAEKLGREPTNAEVYLAHQQGVAGATALINNPGMPAGQAVTMVGGAPTNIKSNGGNPDAPASEFVKHWSDMYDRKLAEAGSLPPYTPVASTMQPHYGYRSGQNIPGTSFAAGGRLERSIPQPSSIIPGTMLPEVNALAPSASVAAKSPGDMVNQMQTQAAEQERRQRALMMWSMLGQALRQQVPVRSGYDPRKVAEAAAPEGPAPQIRGMEPYRPMASPVTGFGRQEVRPLATNSLVRPAAGGGVRAPVFPELYEGLYKQGGV
jgi:hypothetical protein